MRAWRMELIRRLGRRRLLSTAAAAALISSLLFQSAGLPAAWTTVPIGVVLNLSSDVGRTSLSGIPMALKDFYAKNPTYATRLELHVRDSRGDPETTAHAAKDLIKNARVQAIIVAPQTSVEANLLAQLGVWIAIWMEETDLGRYCIPATRRALLDSIHNISFDGLASKFNLLNGELQLPSHEIANLTCKGEMGLSLLPLSLLAQNNLSFDSVGSGSGTIEPVFLREDQVMTLKGPEEIGVALDLDPKPSLNTGPKRGLLERNPGTVCGLRRRYEQKSLNTGPKRGLLERNPGTVCGGDTNKKLLRIGVPNKDGFQAFVNVPHPYFSCQDKGTRPRTTKQITGFSIDIFEAAIKKLKDPVCYEFCVFHGSYDELVGNVSLGKLDGAAGDVTITTNRVAEVAFTMPYKESSVSLLVLSKSEPMIQWDFLEPMTKELWIATVGFIFFTGIVVSVIENPTNPDYQGSFLGQFSNALYFAFSTLTFSHGHNVKSPLTKIVVVVWCLVVLVLVQSYTASFSSSLTAERLREPLVRNLDQLLLNNDYVGYQRGSFVHSMLRNRGFSETRLIPYSKEDEYATALKKGSNKGGVSAIVDEVPYLTTFLSDSPQYRKDFQIVDQIYKTPGFGFVFNLGSCSLAHDLSTAILNITGGDEVTKITEKWLGRSDASPGITKKPASTDLTLRNFSGLFLISGLVSFLMMLISTVRVAHARKTDARDATEQTIDATPSREESGPPEDYLQGAHGSSESAAVVESRFTLNEVGGNSSETTSNDDRSSESPRTQFLELEMIEMIR